MLSTIFQILNHDLYVFDESLKFNLKSRVFHDPGQWSVLSSP